MTTGEEHIIASNGDYMKQIQQAANVIKRMGECNITIVLGSGLNKLSEHLEDTQSLSYSELPGMPTPTVAGHSGRLIRGRVGDTWVLCWAGRVHPYEGFRSAQLTFAVRAAAAAGIPAAILTNAAGGCMKGMHTGDLMLIRDTLNLHHRCLMDDTCGDPKMTSGDMNSSPFSEHLCNYVMDVAKRTGMRVHEGTYVLSTGPSYETHAEVTHGMRRSMAAFGMSTVPESLAASRLGMQVVSMSMITNLAAGLEDAPLTHDDVTDVANKSGGVFQKFIIELLSGMEKLDPLPVAQFADENDENNTSVTLKAISHEQHQSFVELCKKTIGAFSKVLFAPLVFGDGSPAQALNAATRISSRQKGCIRVRKAGGWLVVHVDVSSGFPDEEAVSLAAAMVAAGVNRCVQVVSGQGVSLDLSKCISTSAIPYIENLISFQKAAETGRCLAIPGVFNRSQAAKQYYSCSTSVEEPLSVALAFAAMGCPTDVVPAIDKEKFSVEGIVSSVSLPIPTPEGAIANQPTVDSKQMMSALCTGDPSIRLGLFNSSTPPQEKLPVQKPLLEALAQTLGDLPVSKRACVVVDGRLMEKNDEFQQVSHWTEALPKEALPPRFTTNLEYSFVDSSSDQMLCIRIPCVDTGSCKLLPRRGRDLTAVVRAAKMAGFKSLVVLSAATTDNVGKAVIASDHINLTGENPLYGPNVDVGTRFPDMSNPYDDAASKIITEALVSNGLQVSKGVVLSIGGVPALPEALNLAQDTQSEAICDFGIEATVPAKHCAFPVAWAAIPMGAAVTIKSIIKGL